MAGYANSGATSAFPLTTTLYWKNAWLDHIFGIAEYTPPSTFYMGLNYHAEGLYDGTGNAELNYPDYSRAQVWSIVDSGNFVSLYAKFWDTYVDGGIPDNEGWSGLRVASLWDAANAGNCLAYASLQSKETTSDGYYDRPFVRIVPPSMSNFIIRMQYYMIQ